MTVLAVSTSTRAPALPNVPTVAEAMERVVKLRTKPVTRLKAV